MTEVKRILEECKRQKFLIKQGRNCHYKVYLPNNKIIVISCSPSNKDAYKQILGDFKRAGYPIEI